MRIAAAVPLLLLAAACNAENDAKNDQTMVAVDREGIGNAAAARDTAAELERAGEAVGNEVGTIDVDAEVSNNARPEERPPRVRDFKGKTKTGG